MIGHDTLDWLVEMADFVTHKKKSHPEHTMSIRNHIMLNLMHNHTLRLSRAQQATFALPESESRTKTHEVFTPLAGRANTPTYNSRAIFV